MRVLVVAHPDDEALWFAPETFDRIVIVFMARTDDPGMSERRKQAVSAHPLKDKIVALGLTESNFWRDSAKKREHDSNYEVLCTLLGTLKADEVWTHNTNGEYGHADHILVYRACMDTLNCPVNGKNPAIYRAIKKVYSDHGCWTWSS